MTIEFVVGIGLLGLTFSLWFVPFVIGPPEPEVTVDPTFADHEEQRYEGGDDE